MSASSRRHGLLLCALVLWLSLCWSNAQYLNNVTEGFRNNSGEEIISAWNSAYFPGVLHCNPTQQYNDLPSDGGTLTSFSATCSPSQTTVDSYIRMALYNVSGGTYTLLASTQTGSDLYCPTGNTLLEIATSSGGSLLYANTSALTLTLHPSTDYAICMHATGPDSGDITMQTGWAALSGQDSVEFSGYSMSQPMPASLSSSQSQLADAVYQSWVTLLVSQPHPYTLPSAPVGLSLGWQTVPSSFNLQLDGVVSELRCNNIQTYSSSQLSSTGSPLLSFSATYSPALTDGDGGVCRVALYAIDSGGTYSLAAGTNAFSDLQMAQGWAPGPVTVTSSGPLYYPSGSVYYVLPNVQYALCFYQNDDVLVGDVEMYTFQTGTSNPRLSTTGYSLSQSLPLNPVWTHTTAASFQMWLNVAPTAQSPLSSSSVPVSNSSSAPPGAMSSSTATPAVPSSSSSLLVPSFVSSSTSVSSSAAGATSSLYTAISSSPFLSTVTPAPGTSATSVPSRSSASSAPSPVNTLTNSVSQLQIPLSTYLSVLVCTMCVMLGTYVMPM